MAALSKLKDESYEDLQAQVSELRNEVARLTKSASRRAENRYDEGRQGLVEAYDAFVKDLSKRGKKGARKMEKGSDNFADVLAAALRSVARRGSAAYEGVGTTAAELYDDIRERSAGASHMAARQAKRAGRTARRHPAITVVAAVGVVGVLAALLFRR